MNWVLLHNNKINLKLISTVWFQILTESCNQQSLSVCLILAIHTPYFQKGLMQHLGPKEGSKTSVLFLLAETFILVQ